MAQTLLIEYSVFTPKNTQITEGISGNKNMIVNGVVQRAEEFNHNGKSIYGPFIGMWCYHKTIFSSDQKFTWWTHKKA